MYNKAISLGTRKYVSNTQLAKIIEKCYENCLKIIEQQINENEKENKEMDLRFSTEQIEAYTKLINNYCANKKEEITDIDIIVPNKVVEVTFADETKEKMVCHKDDTFNLRNCLFIAIAKHLYKKEYTFKNRLRFKRKLIFRR